MDIGVITSEILWVHICGIVITISPIVFTYFGREMNFRTEDSIYFGFMAITILTLIWPLYCKR